MFLNWDDNIGHDDIRAHIKTPTKIINDITNIQKSLFGVVRLMIMFHLKINDSYGILEP